MSRVSRTLDRPRAVAIAVAAISLAALAAALVAQYGFGLQPCILCLYQRVPFVVGGVLGLVALLPGLSRPWRVGLIALAGAGFLVNGGIAFYHVGVEQHWWSGASGCSGAPLTLGSIEDLQKAMARPAAVRCDEPAWSLFGITMAGYNVPFSLGLGLLTLVAALRLRRAEGAG